VAFDPKDGRTLWQSVGEKSWTGRPMLGWPGERTVTWRRWEKTASYASLIASTAGGRRVVHALTRQGLAVLDPADGAVLFSRWFRARVDESVNAMTPLVQGDDVFISSAYYRSGSVLLRAAPGATNFTEVWKGLGLEMHWSQPILVGNHLYGFMGRNEPDARLRCVEYATGKVAWERDEGWPSHSSPRPPVFGRGSLILADGKLVALGEGGLLGMFRPDPSRCEELGRWQVPKLRHPCWAGPVLADGRLYLRDDDRLVCLDLRRRGP
jgi:outer membrane protein assembly factor BamB